MNNGEKTTSNEFVVHRFQNEYVEYKCRNLLSNAETAERH